MIKNTITVKQLAALSNLTTARIYQLISDGKLPTLQNGKMPFDEAVSALFKHYQKDSEELKHERLLHTRANRELKERELATAKGEFMSRRVAEASLAAAAKQYHALVRAEIELSGPAQRRGELIRLGVPDMAIQKFHAFDLAAEIGVITKIEKQCAEAGKVKLQ